MAEFLKEMEACITYPALQLPYIVLLYNYTL